MLSRKLEHRLDRPLGPVVRLLAGLGITPNVLTTSGVVLNVIAAVALVFGYLRLGGALIIVGGLCDLLDGALARVMDKQSQFGRLLDSTFDRYSDILPLLGLLVFYSGWNSGLARVTDSIACALVIVGSFLVPYVRAKAEALGADCDVGLAGRAERVIIFAAGLMFRQEVVALWVLAVLTHVTVAQRLLHSRVRLGAEAQVSNSGTMDCGLRDEKREERFIHEEHEEARRGTRG
jgi:CDP-diacylglycerol--glycerol-3-phosphate 3-phosphatidyltransferase